MKIPHFAVVLLISIGAVLGDDCRVVHPVTSSLLRCNGQTYRATPKYMEAVNYCYAGKNGQPYTFSDDLCVYERTGMVRNGKMNEAALREHCESTYRDNAEPIMRGIMACFAQDPVTSRECSTAAFRNACGHRTCDFVNTLD